MNGVVVAAAQWQYRREVGSGADVSRGPIIEGLEGLASLVDWSEIRH